MIVMNLTRKGRTPSALHIIMTNLFPVNIQFLQSFQHFGHYFSWMCSRLTQNKEMLNREVGRRKRTYGDNMRLDYLKPKSPFPLSWKMWSQPNWRLHKYLLTIPTCWTWCFIWWYVWEWGILCAKKSKQKMSMGSIYQLPQQIIWEPEHASFNKGMPKYQGIEKQYNSVAHHSFLAFSSKIATGCTKPIVQQQIICNSCLYI